MVDMNYRFWIFSILVILFSNSALASTCSSTQDRIFAVCDMGVCENFLYIVEVGSNSNCSRRPSIEQLPSWAKEVVEFEVHNSELSGEQGIFELVLDGKSWSNAYIFSNADEYRLYYEKAKKNGFPMGELNRISGKSKEELEIEWRLKEKKAYRKMLVFNTLNWLALAVATLCLVYSILWFNKWQRSLISLKWAVLALGMQALIFTISFAGMSTWAMPPVMLLGIFIPGIWLYQITTFLSLWWSTRTRT